MAVLLTKDSVPTGVNARPWLWLNLLSIDAPFIAVAWQLWFARCFGITLPPLSVVALASAVWMIYAADRLLDVSRPQANPTTGRHRFHRNHASILSVAVVLCFLSLVTTACFLNPILLRDGLVLSAVVALYFILVHGLPAAIMSLCPKEIMVGIVFAVGAGLAPWSQMPKAQPLIAPVAMLACLCFLNCAAIEVWEWKRLGGRAPHALTLFTANYLRFFTTFIAVTAVALFALPKLHLVFAPIAVSALAFLWLDAERDRLPADLLRVLADVPLLSPLLLLGLH